MADPAGGDVDQHLARVRGGDVDLVGVKTLGPDGGRALGGFQDEGGHVLRHSGHLGVSLLGVEKVPH
ncbi:hypothetical protein [Brachybacterium subflavum]|uniref:hypothetical protein n=1 Tax=Brachybacterium subflavum TaxID=2585206 RepID=UPI0012668321|nr:hypothetical protein [Brachybacterium subflavum]